MEISKSTFALVYFHVEKKYSILKAKDALKPSDQQLDLKSWDKTQSIMAKWDGDGEFYPANILQFGENKKDMEPLIDGLAAGSILPEDIPVVQSVGELKKRGRTKSHQEATKPIEKTKRQKEATVKQIKNEKQLSILSTVSKSLQEHEKCSSCETLNMENAVMNKKFTELAGQITAANEAANHMKMKYKALKKKYKLCKQNGGASREMQENYEVETVKIGDNLTLEKSKLALCRVGDFSKYTCDLLDVVFGRENLGNSVIKGIKGCNKKVLDAGYVSDIQGHVASKFNVNVALVRATIRNKLNSASKAMKSKPQ